MHPHYRWKLDSTSVKQPSVYFHTPGHKGRLPGLSLRVRTRWRCSNADREADVPRPPARDRNADVRDGTRTEGRFQRYGAASSSQTGINVQPGINSRLRDRLSARRSMSRYLYLQRLVPSRGGCFCTKRVFPLPAKPITRYSATRSARAFGFATSRYLPHLPGHDPWPG